MYLDYLVPSWHEIESRVIAMVGYPSGGQFRTSLNEEVASLGLNLRRIEAVRTAFYHAEWQAAHLLRQRFADLDINSIVDELLRVVQQMAMIVVGSTVTGGLLGAGVGAFAGGAGTIPFAGAGAAMGLKVSGLDPRCAGAGLHCRVLRRGLAAYRRVLRRWHPLRLGRHLRQ
ncbi:hypothetical protein YSA_06622 [Pseudomonas putida ND6]|uniref:NAD(+)--protein-arginine ADP-ribosyltransferase Tre1-like N-terminal domain-containing protein n=1 Tax=Pseudomonas putida ND6 TaxID=231023 RepID=I3UXX1_PSEPU|nr:hypothetical protein YSA_06622 [Pseudomonas putida ND6]